MRLRQHETVKINRVTRGGFFTWGVRTAIAGWHTRFCKRHTASLLAIAKGPISTPACGPCCGDIDHAIPAGSELNPGTNLVVGPDPGTSGKRRAYVSLAVMALLCSGVLCLWPAAKTPAVVHAGISATYADPATCIRCHADIAKTYRETGMGRSFHRVNASDRSEDFAARKTLYNQASDRYYTMTEKNGELYEQRHQIGFDQKETNLEEMQIDYVIGSGNHSRTYLHRTAEGKLLQLPVSWYSEMGGTWQMSPGYDRSDQQDFRRAIGYECMSCHNAYPAPDQVMRTDDENLFGANLPQGIDCQRCHGPGSTHVRAASTPGASPESIRAAIVNPGTLSRDRQMDVCQQCHLETTSLRLPHSIRNYTRAPFSYRPGEPLTEYELFFDHQPGTGFDDHFEVAQQAYRLKKSACFLKSQMTCITCHDPHVALRGDEATKHYIAVCRSCHTAVHASMAPVAGSNCLTCHMWKRRTEDAVHVVMTDHYIQRSKPKKDFLAPLQEIAPEYHNEVVPYSPKSVAQVSDGELYLATAQVDQQSNLEAGTPRLKQAIEKYKPENPEFYFDLATAYAKSGNNDAAIRWYQEALRHRPDDAASLRELAATLASVGNLAQAATVGENAAATQPVDTTVLINLGSVYLQQGRIEDSKRLLNQALAIDPTLPDANVFLGLAAMSERDVPAAESFFRSAINLQPDFAEAHNDLASILGSRGAYLEAAYHLKKAVEANPKDAQLHRNYGMFLDLTGAPDKAITELNEAVRLNPTSAPLHVDLGKLLAKRGDASQAEQEYRKALAQNDNYGEAHLRLAGLLALRGHFDEARQHYQKAAEDPNPRIRQAALNALRR
jgi:Tfp pilus assembly protein PilF